jgi:hypothetical protein
LSDEQQDEKGESFSGTRSINSMLSMNGAEGVELHDYAPTEAGMAPMVFDPELAAVAKTLKVDQRYELGGLVARGGMGAVLRARDVNCRRPVARRLNVVQDAVTLVFVGYIAMLAVEISGVLGGTRSAAMQIPMSYVYAGIVIGFTLAALRLAVRLARAVRSVRGAV